MRHSLRPSSLLRYALLLCALWGSQPLHGAELRLKNGDILAGELIRREEGRIFFRSETLGEISVAADQAVVVDTPATPVESLAGLPPSGTPPAKTPGGKEDEKTGTPSKSRWQGQLELGYQQQTGRQDSINTSIRANAERAFSKNDLHAEGRMLYGEQDDATNTNRLDTLFRWRHKLSERTFAQSQTSFTKDRIKGIRQNYEENLGFGVQLFEGLRQSANIGAGLTAQYREATGVESGMGCLGEAFQDFTFRLSGRLTFLESASALTSLSRRSRQVAISDSEETRTENDHDYRLRFSTTLQGKITNRVSLNLRFEYEFDSAIEQASARADKRLTTSIGYGF